MNEVIEVIEKNYMFVLLQLSIILIGFLYVKKKGLNDKLQYDMNYKKLMLAYSELAKSESELRENYNELNEKDKKIEFLAYYDTLTKLPNKENLLERLQALITSNVCTNGFSMIFIDVDNFKNINDILGHDYGDKLLILICEVLKLALPNNTSLYRWGGDEFIIILENYIEKEEIIKVAHGILNYLKYEFEIGEKQINLTLSMGITIFPEYGNNSNDIIKNAEVAMYESKKLGRNKYNFYNIEMHSFIKRKDEISKYLKTAKSKNELKLVFQPKFDNKSREIIGYEALLRWYNSELGQVSPSEFIAVAEESDLIIDIGNWVIRTACMQNQKWIERGYRKPVAVNVSAVQFERDTFASNIMEILKETDMSPELLEIEITEKSRRKSLDSMKTDLDYYMKRWMRE